MSTPAATFTKDEILAELNRIAQADRNSLPTRIDPSKMDEILALIANDLVAGYEIEIAVIAALGRVREAHRDWFYPSRKKRRVHIPEWWTATNPVSENSTTDEKEPFQMTC